jgi:general secretion pathway protein D
VLVLGGLLRQGQTEAEKGLPLLNNIPLVGNLFTRRSAPERQNLVVFITPTIVDD